MTAARRSHAATTPSAPKTLRWSSYPQDVVKPANQKCADFGCQGSVVLEGVECRKDGCSEFREFLVRRKGPFRFHPVEGGSEGAERCRCLVFDGVGEEAFHAVRVPSTASRQSAACAS